MGLDLRWPIGLMFSLIGVLLTGLGLFNASASTTKVADSSININLIWGIVLLVFGALMLLAAIAGKKKSGPPNP
jgi:hypothetical protein